VAVSITGLAVSFLLQSLAASDDIGRASMILLILVMFDRVWLAMKNPQSIREADFELGRRVGRKEGRQEGRPVVVPMLRDTDRKASSGR